MLSPCEIWEIILLLCISRFARWFITTSSQVCHERTLFFQFGRGKRCSRSFSNWMFFINYCATSRNLTRFPFRLLWSTELLFPLSKRDAVSLIGMTAFFYLLVERLCLSTVSKLCSKFVQPALCSHVSGLIPGENVPLSTDSTHNTHTHTPRLTNIHKRTAFMTTLKTIVLVQMGQESTLM